MKGTLTHGQVSCLIYAGACGNIVYTFTYVVHVCGRAGWVAVLIGVLLNIPLAMWILSLGKRFQGKTIFDLIETGLGKFVSGTVVFLYLLVTAANAVCMLNMTTGAIRVFFLHNTPTTVIMLIFVSICAVCANSGIFTIGRLIQLLTVMYTSIYFLGFFLSFAGIFKLEYVFPVFDTTIPAFAEGVWITAGTVAESLLFLMVLVGAMTHDKSNYRSVRRGLATWSVILSLALLIMEGDVGHEMLSRIAEAGVAVAGVIEIKSFVRGLEIFIIMTYQYLAICKVIIYLYSSQESLKKLFGGKGGKWMLIIAALFILVPSIWVNSLNTGYFFSLFLGSYVIPAFVAVILILASFGAVRIKKRKGAAA